MNALILVTLPIGNLKDITERVLDILYRGIYFYAEDTRVFRLLLSRLKIESIGKKIDSFHEHSGSEKIYKILSHLKRGETVYIVSDAGSPLISDPAYPLISRVIEEGMRVDSCPGVSSIITAIELSGLPPTPFSFYGFLPKLKSKRRKIFKKIFLSSTTCVFFDSPQRIHETMIILEEDYPDSRICLARELTKTHQSVHRFIAKDYRSICKQITYLGEFILVISPVLSRDQIFLNQEKLSLLVSDYIKRKRSPKLLAKLFSHITGESVPCIYEQLIDHSTNIQSSDHRDD